jgi:RNA polymerase sigma factor (sigma-70 family)
VRGRRTRQDDEYDAFVRRYHHQLQERAWQVAIQTGTDQAVLFSHALEVTWRSWSRILPFDRVRLAFAGKVMVRKANGERSTSARRHEFPDDQAAGREYEVRPGCWGDDPAAQVERREDGLAVHRAIARLPQEEKRIMMYRTQDLGLVQIALETGRSYAEVRNGLERAKRSLRKELGLPQRGDDDAR